MNARNKIERITEMRTSWRPARLPMLAGMCLLSFAGSELVAQARPVPAAPTPPAPPVAVQEPVRRGDGGDAVAALRRVVERLQEQELSDSARRELAESLRILARVVGEHDHEDDEPAARERVDHERALLEAHRKAMDGQHAQEIHERAMQRAREALQRHGEVDEARNEFDDIAAHARREVERALNDLHAHLPHADAETPQPRGRSRAAVPVAPVVEPPTPGAAAVPVAPPAPRAPRAARPRTATPAPMQLPAPGLQAYPAPRARQPLPPAADDGEAEALREMVDELRAEMAEVRQLLDEIRARNAGAARGRSASR